MLEWHLKSTESDGKKHGQKLEEKSAEEGFKREI